MENDKDLSERGGFDISTQVEGQTFKDSFKTVNHTTRENFSLRRRTNLISSDGRNENCVVLDKNVSFDDKQID